MKMVDVKIKYMSASCAIRMEIISRDGSNRQEVTFDGVNLVLPYNWGEFDEGPRLDYLNKRKGYIFSSLAGSLTPVQWDNVNKMITQKLYSSIKLEVISYRPNHVFNELRKDLLEAITII